MALVFPFLSSLISRAPEMVPARVHIGFISSLPRLSTLLPYTMDGPFKTSMNFLLRLAWTSKIQLPVLIAVAFMTFDIRLQLEINIFWEANQRPVHNQIVNNDRPVNRDGENVNGYAFIDQIVIDTDSLLGHSYDDESSSEYTSDEDEDDDDILVFHHSGVDRKICSNSDDSSDVIDADLNSTSNSTFNISSDNNISSTSVLSELLNLNHQPSSSDDNANNSEKKIVR